MCEESEEYATLQVDDWKRARVEHECCACELPIRRGDYYHHCAILYDGHWQTYKHCIRCQMMCEALWAAGAEAIDLTLNCGERWENTFGCGECKPEIAALAFMTPDDMQQCVRADRVRKEVTERAVQRKALLHLKRLAEKRSRVIV